MKLKNIVLLLTLTLLLTACGSGKKCADRVWTGEFGLCLEKGWEQVPNEVLREKGIPEETIAAFHLSEKRGGQRDNIVISRERLPAAIPSKTFSSANIETIEGMPAYALIEKRSMEIDGKETILHVFTARPISDLPARRFYQLSVTKSTRGYTVTGTLPFSTEEDIEEKMINMLLNVTLEGEEE